MFVKILTHILVLAHLIRRRSWSCCGSTLRRKGGDRERPDAEQVLTERWLSVRLVLAVVRWLAKSEGFAPNAAWSLTSVSLFGSAWTQVIGCWLNTV
jgi:hypothetical protein